ncbi:MAG: ISAs1 family transposase [Saprospiraceae bacterium]|nr:ISAs1 family transposase [Saprospiraceae bacterium]
MDFLEISGCIITLDAMGCQKTITEKIVDKGGDYIMGLKDNQEALSLAVFTAFSKQEEQANADKELWEVKNHGRKESRLCRVLPAEALPSWGRAPDWKGLKSVVEIQSQRTILSTGVVENETRYYTSRRQVFSIV